MQGRAREITLAVLHTLIILARPCMAGWENLFGAWVAIASLSKNKNLLKNWTGASQ